MWRHNNVVYFLFSGEFHKGYPLDSSAAFMNNKLKVRWNKCTLSIKQCSNNNCNVIELLTICFLKHITFFTRMLRIKAVEVLTEL